MEGKGEKEALKRGTTMAIQSERPRVYDATTDFFNGGLC